MALLFLISVLRISVPLIFASLGGYFSERSGIVQIALEGWMTLGAFTAAAVTLYTHNPYVGFLSGGLLSGVACLFYGMLVIQFKLDQIVSGTIINLLAMGIVPMVGKLLYQSTGGTPNLPMEELFSSFPLFLSFAAVILVFLLSCHTRFGLRLRFSGEEPKAVLAAGFSVKRIRYQALFLCGVLAGLGGASLSIYLSSGYSRNMVAGRGFMALAALIFGNWRTLPTAMACLLWGLFEAIQIHFQNAEFWQAIGLPVAAFQLLPYVVTIIVLAGFVGRARAPKALGRAI